MLQMSAKKPSQDFSVCPNRTQTLQNLVTVLPLNVFPTETVRISPLLPFVDIVEGKIKKRVRVVRLVESRKLEKAEYYEQKGVDVKLAIDMIALARIQAFDVAILVSGDSDFVGLAELVKQFNLHILNAHCPASREHSYYYSKELERICDRPPIILDRHFLSDCVST